MTNNPKKRKALEFKGIEVVQRPLIESNGVTDDKPQFNIRPRREKLGHNLIPTCLNNT